MLWMIPLATAAIGAMRAKQRGGSMLRGGVTGGLLGAGAAYAAPAMMGSMGAGGAGAAGTAGSYGAGAYGTAEGYGGAGAATLGGTTAATPGLLGTMGAYAKPAMTAMSAAQMANGLLGGDKQAAPLQAPQNNSAQGAQILSELYKSGQPGMTPEQQMRMQRRKTMWG